MPLRRSLVNLPIKLQLYKKPALYAIMESNWADLASGVHGRIAKALAVFNRHAPRDINLVQARALVKSLVSADATTQRAATWPQVLSLLTTWVKTLDKSGRAAVANTKRPLRPWERQQQQQTPATAQQGGSLVATQQQAQQSQQAQHDVLQQATNVVISALQEAAAAAHVQGSASRNTDVLIFLGPCITFLGAAVTAVAATAGEFDSGGTQLHQQLLESSVAAVCSALIAVAPVLLAPAAAAAVDGSHTFTQLLLSVQHLLVACQDDDICQLWLLSCLLAAVQEALTCGLPPCIAAAASSSSCPANATLAVQQGTLWKAHRAQKLAVLQISASLKDLYSVGQALGSMFAKAIAAAASPTQQQQQQQQISQEELLPEFVLLQKFDRLVDLLCIGCNDGDLSLVAVTAAAAAGVVAGSLEMLPSDAAAAAGSLGDVWATTVAAGKTVKQQQQQQQSQPAMQPAAVLDPQWLQQLKGQLSLLLHAFDSAARRCIDATGAVAAADNALPQAGALLLGYTYSKLMATHSDALGSLQQQQSTASVHCGLLYIMHHCCGLAGVMHHAGCCSDAAAANAWLAAQQQQHPPHEVALLVRWLATAVANAPTDEQQLLLHAVREESEQVAVSYDCYTHVTRSDVLQQVNAGAVRVFATVVAVLASAWQQQQQQQMAKADSSSSGGATAAAVVGQGLAALAALQFCRVDLPAYVDLLRGLVGAVASSSAAADAFLAAAVPCYDALLQPVAGVKSSSCSSSGSCNAQCSNQGHSIECECSANNSGCCCSSADRASGRAWLDSPVLIARLSFLLPLLPVACNASSDAAAATSRVLPLVLLLLPHPVQQLSHGAHAAFAGLLTAATDAMQQSEATNAQQQRQSMLTVVEQAIPFYLQRSVEGLPHSGSLEGLAIGFTCILKQLPAGSVMSLLAINKVTQCAMQLAVEAHATAAIPADTVDPKVQQEVQQQTAAVHDTSRSTDIPPRTAATAAARLFEVLQMSLQLVDFRQLPSVLQHISAAVLAAPFAVQSSWIKGLYGSCLATDDYARKPALMTWIDDLHRRVVQVQQARQRAAADAVLHNTQQGKGADGGLKPTQPPFLIV